MIKTTFTLIILAVFFNACAHKQEIASTRKASVEKELNSEITASAADRVDADYYAEVEFKAKKANLSPLSKSTVNKLIHLSKDGDRISQVYILSWGDEEYPSENLKKLSQEQIQLAERRNQVLKKYIEKTAHLNQVYSFNMAEQPSTFAKWMNTTDSELKKTLVKAGLPTTADNPQFPSKAMHSVILVK